MRRLIALAVFVPCIAYAQEQPLPTGKEYAAGEVSSKTSQIMQILDEVKRKEVKIKELEEELKKYKENSWLP